MKMKKRLFGILLSLALMFGLIPGMSLTALAYDGNPYAGLVNTTTTVMFNGIDWYIIADNSTAADAGTVTLLAKEPIAAESFSIGGSINTYSSSTVNSYLKGLVDGTSTFGESKSFKDVAGAINTVYIKDGENNIENASSTSGEGYYGVKLYLLSYTEVISTYQLLGDILKCSKADGADENVWWLRSPGGQDIYAACFILFNNGLMLSKDGRVDRKFGVRPALKLNLSSVVYSSVSKSFSLRQTITAADVTATYGDTGKKITATTDGGGAISYAVKNGSENYIDVASDGKLTIKKVPADSKAYVTVTAAANGLYAQATRGVTVTISKANSSIKTAPKAINPTYNGSAQALVTAGEATGGAMAYALGNDEKTAPTSGWGTSIPKRTDAGTYYVWYKAVGDETHSDSAADFVTAKIDEKSEPDVVYGIRAVSDKSVELEEGGTETLKVQVYKITGDTETEIVEDIKVDWKTEDNDIVTLASKGDYAVECDVTAVKAGTATVTASILNDAYSVAFDVTVTAKTAPSYYDGVSETYYKITLAESEGGKLTASRATAPKGATVTVTAAPDDGYQAETPAVKDKDGKEIPVTQNTDGTWSFPMPGSDVTVTGSFVREKAPLKFVDVPEDAWYYNDVYWAAENGVALGTDDTHFSPDGDCSRGQFVTFLWRAAGQPAPTGTENPFEDVKPGDYCYEAVLWAVENGITKGVDETHFAPAAPLTRAQAITFLYRYEQSVGKGFTGLWAFRLDYPDVSDVPDWAYEAFCWMTMEGIVRGSDGMLLPGKLCPRCQVVALLARVFAA